MNAKTDKISIESVERALNVLLIDDKFKSAINALAADEHGAWFCVIDVVESVAYAVADKDHVDRRCKRYGECETPEGDAPDVYGALKDNGNFKAVIRLLISATDKVETATAMCALELVILRILEDGL